MALIRFTRNYTDHSNNEGFQFEFCCDRCGNGHMSSFAPSKAGVAGGFLRAASSFFGGGVLDRIADAGDHLKDSTRGKARDEAFARAVQEAMPHFRQCSRCGKWVCPEQCWNAKRGLCEECAPDLEEELAAAQATAAREQVWEKARATDLTANVNMSVEQAAACPSCGAKAQGSKFCPECGKPMRPKNQCTQCGSKIEAGVKFCPECGTKT
jgi:hypothetical protein